MPIKKAPAQVAQRPQLGKKLIWPPKLIIYTPSQAAKAATVRPFGLGEAKPHREGARC